jgi:hypothetical protein
VWADPFIIDVDGLLIGVRTTLELDGPLRDALEPLLRPDIVDGPVNYSLNAATDDRSFHVLYWGGCIAVRTRDPARLAAGLAAHLGGHAEPPALVRLHASGAVRPDGSVALLPSLTNPGPLDRRLRAAGCALIDAPYVDIDPATLEVVGHAPSLAPGVVSALAAALAPLPSGDPEPLTSPARRRLAVLALPRPLDAGPGAVVHRLLQLVPVADRANALPALAELARRIPAEPLDGDLTRTVAVLRGG